MSTENVAVAGSESETIVVTGLTRPRNSRTAFVKAWNGNINPETGEVDADVVAGILGVSRQTVMQKSSDLRNKGVPLAPVKRKQSASNAVSLADLAALAASLVPTKPEAVEAPAEAPAA